MSRFDMLHKKASISSSLLIYLIFFAANALISLLINGISYEGEFASIASAAAIMGRSWTGIMPQASSVANALVSGLPLIPSMLLCPVPTLQYKFFLITNSALYALVPFIIYRIAAKAGITKEWQRIAAAVICGAAPCMIMRSHCTDSEGYSVVFVWLLIWLLTSSNGAESDKKRRRLRTISLAFVTAGAYFCCRSLISVFFAVLAYLIIMQLANKRKLAIIWLYAGIVILLIAADIAVTLLIPEIGLNVDSTAVFLFKNTPDISRIPQLICGRLYYMIVSTFGFAAAGFAIAIITVIMYYRRKKQNRPTEYTEGYAAGGILFLLLMLLILPVDAVYNSFTGGELDIGTAISAPAVICFALPLAFHFLILLFRYKLDFPLLMSAIAGISGLSFTAIFGLTELADKTSAAAGILAELSPMRPGSGLYAPINSDNILYPICFILIVFAVLITVICSAEKKGAAICGMICSGVGIYAVTAGIAALLIMRVPQNGEKATSAVKITECISSYRKNPRRIAVCDNDKLLAMHLQYTNQSAEIIFGDSGYTDCFAISTNPPEYEYVCLLIGRTDGYNIYAAGNIPENAPENTPDNSLSENPSDSNTISKISSEMS